MAYVSIIAIVVTLSTSGLAYGEYIAQMNVQQGSESNRIFIKLLEKDAPLTVQNFRNYVGDGDYTHTFIHRVAFDSVIQDNFIIQGGGFTFDPLLNSGDFIFDTAIDSQLGGLQLVPEDAPVDDEVGSSNVRGTLAMAKLDTQNSARSQWFINLVDNSFLDVTANGGFTVFAEVLGDGMNVVDNIASKTIFDRSDIHADMSDIPLVNYLFPDAITDENLVLINSIVEVISITPDINYGTATPGTNLQPEVVLLNTGNTPVLIGNLAGQNSLSTPFSIVSDFCSNGTLFPGQRCSFIALFSPSTSGVFNNSFDIAFPDLGINYIVNLSGEGGPVAVEPDIASQFTSVNFGAKDIIFEQDEDSYYRFTTISNVSNVINVGEQVDFNTITLSPDSDAEFSISEFTEGVNCIDVASLDKLGVCQIGILYRPLAEGDYTAKLIIESNDPDESSFEILIFASAYPEDTDGISTAVEDAEPNNGDGNNDGVPDSRQSNVASLPDFNGNYNTYVSEQLLNQVLRDVRIVNQDADDENPDNIIIEAGVHEFTIENVGFDEIVEVGLLLPADVKLEAYYVFGATPDNVIPHWYQFDFDGEVGAAIIEVAEITSPAGNTVKRNVMFLRFENGGRGDSSSVQDNKIVVKSGINYSKRKSSGGSLSLFFLLIIVLMLSSLKLCPYSSMRFRNVG